MLIKINLVKIRNKSIGDYFKINIRVQGIKI